MNEWGHTKSRKWFYNGFVRWDEDLFLVTVLLLFFVPFIFLVINSFAMHWSWPQVWPKTWSFRGWFVLWQQPRLVEALLVTTLIGGGVVLLNLLLAFPAAKALSQTTFICKHLVEQLLLAPILIPSLAVAMGIHLLMIQLGMANVWYGVVLVHLIPTIPYAIRILRSGYDQLGTAWHDQANSLGVKGWTILWTITVPFMLPSIRSVMLLAYVISLSQYALTALIGGGNVMTLAMIYFPFLQSVDRAVISSFSLVFALMPLVFVGIAEISIRLMIRIYRDDIPQRA